MSTPISKPISNPASDLSTISDAVSLGGGSKPDAARQAIISGSGRCVMCGLCLPHCPTYQLARREGDGPRGRLSLAQALANDHLPDQADLRGAIDRCLGCRRCEAVCPAGVPYGEVLNATRSLLGERRSTGRIAAMGHWLIQRPARVRAMAGLTRMLQRLGLLSLGRALMTRLMPRAALTQAVASLPSLRPMPRRAPRYFPEPDAAEPAKEPARLGLLLGCVSDALDARTNDDAIAVLTQMGYQLEVPPDQVCCGSLAHHAGKPQTANRLTQINQRAFAKAQAKRWVSTATGCSSHLSEQLSPRVDVVDLCELLLEDSPAGLAPPIPTAPAEIRCVVHTPCTQRYPLGQAGISQRILERIPGLKVVSIESGHGCCGAAGSYFMRQADWAGQLRDALLADFDWQPGDILVTANIGCAVHLRAGLTHHGLTIQVCHPVSVLHAAGQGRLKALATGTTS